MCMSQETSGLACEHWACLCYSRVFTDTSHLEGVYCAVQYWVSVTAGFESNIVPQTWP